MDKITVIMASYNGERYIREQIDSIFKNAYPDLELHIFDDGSTDHTVALIEECKGFYPGQIFLHKNPSNQGVVRNFLLGAMKLESDYYMFADQDDVWMPDKIKKTLACIKEVEEQEGVTTPAAVFTDAVVTDIDLQELHPSFHRQSGLDCGLIDFNHMLMENKVIGCTLMFNRALWDKLRKLPEGIRWHDWWIGLVASGLGNLSYLPEPTMYYRQHGDNVVGNQNFLKYAWERFSNIFGQKKVILKTIRQAQAFYEVYYGELDGERKKTLHIFCKLCKINWFRRRYLLLSYHFLKSGLLRNVGLLLVV